LEERLNALPVKERERGYKPAESIFSLMGSIAAGGEALDDIALLAGDEGMRRLLGEMPAANTLGELLRRFGPRAVHLLGWIVLKVAAKVIRACKLSWVTIDIDAYFLESQKEGVLMNCDGLEGYCPVMVTCAELKMPLAGAFRPGNASPMANLSSLLRRVLKQCGFGLSKLPCRDFMANAAYFQMAMLAAVVTAAFKHLVLPKGWQTFTIQTLRFRLIRLAGTVCKKSRYLWLKIPGAYPFRDVLEEARYRVLGIGCEIGSTG
jgi:hypothetical protein